MAFPITCPACGKAFQLATEVYERKVAGKIVSIKCKQCQSGIRVDATQPGELKVIGATPAGTADLSVGPKPPPAPPAAQVKPAAPEAMAPKPAAPVRMRQPTLIGMINPQATAQKTAAAQKPAAPVVAPVAPPPLTLWAVDTGGNEDRELNEDEIQREILVGKLTAQTLAWREGMAEWLEIEKIPELSRFLGSPPEVPKREPKAPAPRMPEPPPAREAPKAEPQHASFQDEPDAEATMVYDRSAPDAALEPFAAPPPPQKTDPLGQAPPPPPLPAAGRPAPAAGRPAPAAGRPAPAAAPAPAPPPPPIPEARPAQPPIPAAAPAAPPAPPAFPPVAARPAVLAAVPWGDPAPSMKPHVPGLPTAPLGPDPFAIAASTDLDFPNPKSKRPLVIAAVVGLVAVVGIGIAIASSSSPPVANIAPPPPAPTTPATTPKPAEAETTPEAPRANSDDSPSPAAQAPTPSGNFSDLFAKGAEKAKGTDGKRGFDEAAGREALSGLLKTAASCKEPGGPTGQATATITFEPSGAVSNVTVGEPFSGSSVGTCIITTFKRAKVASFSGLPGTVSQVISLR